jgi:hypothetical protein
MSFKRPNNVLGCSTRSEDVLPIPGLLGPLAFSGSTSRRSALLSSARAARRPPLLRRPLWGSASHRSPLLSQPLLSAGHCGATNCTHSSPAAALLSQPLCRHPPLLLRPRTAALRPQQTILVSTDFVQPYCPTVNQSFKLYLRELIQCALCPKQIKGGIKRVKQHLAGDYGDIVKVS